MAGHPPAPVMVSITLLSPAEQVEAQALRGGLEVAQSQLQALK